MSHHSSAFDIVGPVMVGPSSSHTAGAVKLGQIARAIFDKTPDKVTFVLHGSFATVYKGHSTDKALLAGIMKFKTADPRIKNADKIAKRKGIRYEIKTEDLGIGYHPNTVKIVLEAKGRKKMSIIGSSLGGGEVEVKRIDDFDVDIKGVAGKYFTLVIAHKNVQGMISRMTSYVSGKRIIIASMQSARLEAGGRQLTILNCDSPLTLKEVLEMEKIPNVYFVRTLHKIV
ncbi:L-serine ammonia-lyase, iron-sulfur-dependent subunit beta [Patescibacteria group bacterium]|nr:L-serine ammonia-lyase, iron-sulfur-dependent subunit beta [Patescibacteria group bacterium]